MFKATIQDVSFLKDIFDSVSSLITEATFRLSNEGIELTAMDAASVAMVILKILPSAFIEYECDKEEQMTINIGNFVNVLKRAKANDKITLELGESKLKIKMIGDFKRNFSIPLIDITQTQNKAPELSFKCKVELVSNALKDGIKDASMVSDCVIFEAKPDSFTIKSFGDLSETALELTKDSPSLISIECNEEIKAKYSIDYLEKMMKALKSNEKVTLKFSSDYPVRIDYASVDRFQLSYILAPRVDTE